MVFMVIMLVPALLDHQEPLPDGAPMVLLKAQLVSTMVVGDMVPGDMAPGLQVYGDMVFGVMVLLDMAFGVVTAMVMDGKFFNKIISRILIEDTTSTDLVYRDYPHYFYCIYLECNFQNIFVNIKQINLFKLENTKQLFFSVLFRSFSFLQTFAAYDDAA